MQIQNIQLTNLNNQNTNFKSIKKIELCGLYKKNPELGNKLIDTFRRNPEAMEFCKKYDVSVYFDALKDNYNRVKTSLYIFYDNPAVSKVKKFFKFLNSSEDKINIQGYDYGLEESTNALMDHMLPSNYSSRKGNATGVLSSNIEYADGKIQEILNKKAAKKAAAINKESEIAAKKEELQTATEKLNSSIQDLIESTK